ncbi:GPP34 family phosphoprotein [Planosporangium flavigriseum]|uniref:Golgi phosphoprotein 3 (GPP34) n=1 Tax=Planosporangium flavigriseum TaxID=373681 RepID=A0A8J3LYT7_9ACTN|nr:GPP34 family phosphoprotein [Planosporangium flavigriseum]NJC65737.1 GPP34 family phosphoprotein [Planosporangium flavigriseum]GIG73590.1 hypothetical protein Pfl04_19940 [Planosporangium flavigriseum]
MTAGLSDGGRWSDRLHLADDFWVIVHNADSGRPRLNETRRSLGLAGALLGELVLSGHLVIHDRNVYITDVTPPVDATSHLILEQIVAESQAHHVQVWVKFLADSAAATMTDRLMRAGLVEREQQRRRLRQTTVVYRPVDPNRAYWRPVLLRQALAGRYGPTGWPDMFLAGLVEATGLLPAVLQEDHAAGRSYLAHWLPRADPPSLNELVVAVRALVGHREEA